MRACESQRQRHDDGRGLVENQEEAVRIHDLADRPTAWRLERNHREVMFAARPELSVFAESTSAQVGRTHAHPAWALLLPARGGSITVTNSRSGEVHRDGVLLEPQRQYRAATDGPHVAMYLSAWMAPRARGLEPHTIGPTATRRLLDALDLHGGVDLDAGLSELAQVVGPIRPVDARLAVVIEGLAEAHRLEVLAAEVGLSPSRLRAVARSTVGAPLTHLRLWSRLSRAVAWLPHAPTAVVAAEAGFADQPHLTRTARRFLGRTPGELHLRSLELQPPNGAGHGQKRRKWLPPGSAPSHRAHPIVAGRTADQLVKTMSGPTSPCPKTRWLVSTP